MNLKIFTIIVTYNGMQWIEKCLKSIISSEIYTSIIIIDNGSSDGTQKFITTNFKKVKLIQTKENIGFGQGNNIGIKLAIQANADYVFLLNQDAWIQKDSFKLLMESHKCDPSFGIVSPVHLNGLGNNLDKGFYSYVNPQKCLSILSDCLQKKQMHTLYEVEFVNAAAWLISKDCLLKTGGFSPLFFHYGEDVDYANRAKYHGFRIGICPATYINHDRENREPNSFNSLENVNRIVEKVKYANPSEEFSLDEAIESLNVQAKHFFRILNMRKYWFTKKRIKELLILKKELKTILPIVKEGGSCFLGENLLETEITTTL